MIRYIYVALLLSACGSEPKSDLDIVGGAKVYRQWYGRLEVGNAFRCGSTLIDSRWALTAEHCLRKPEQHSRVKVRFGSYDLNGNNNAGRPYDLVKVGRVYLHPNKDLALLKLERKAKFKPIPYGNPRLIEGDKVQAFGMGNKSYDQGGGNILRAVTLRFIEQTKAPHMIHATGGIGKAICFGDSGGPLIIRKNGKPFLVGVSSWTGSRCGSNNGPSGFAKPDLKWIRKILN